MEGRLLVDKGIEEPFVGGVERMVCPPPTGSPTTEGIPVIGPQGGADVQEIRFNGIFDDHTQFIHGKPSLCFVGYNRIIASENVSVKLK
jgi:hypothetical protein